MTFLEKYRAETTWHGKVGVMEIYHLAMTHNHRKHTIAQTARMFECSLGLVSENLKLAEAIHKNKRILKCESRQEALKWLQQGV